MIRWPIFRYDISQQFRVISLSTNISQWGRLYSRHALSHCLGLIGCFSNTIDDLNHVPICDLISLYTAGDYYLVKCYAWPLTNPISVISSYRRWRKCYDELVIYMLMAPLDGRYGEKATRLFCIGGLQCTEWWYKQIWEILYIHHVLNPSVAETRRFPYNLACTTAAWVLILWVERISTGTLLHIRKSSLSSYKVHLNCMWHLDVTKW